MMATEPTYAKPISELRSLSDEHLIAQHDALLQNRVVVGVNYYVEELARRQMERLTKRLVTLTRALVFLTVVVMALTIVLVLEA
jgi:hypothetical protein